MNNLFNYDNSFFTFLGKVCDILFLSVIWAIVCIPIITIGPANTALYYATVKVIRRERGYLFREFFKSFRMNFLRGAVIGVGMTLVLIILALDIFTSSTAITGNVSLNSIFFGIYLAITFFVLSMSLYMFPVLSRFNMNVKQLVKAAAFMSVKHLLYTIAMLIILLSAIAAVVFIPVTIVIVPAASTLLISLFMERLLKRYIPKSKDGEENETKDEWYLE